jgi:hypothetical protein
MKLDRDTQFVKSVYLKNELISSYRQFPLSLPVIRNFQEILCHPNVTCIIE